MYDFHENGLKMVIVVLGLRNMKNAIVDELCMIDDVSVSCF